MIVGNESHSGLRSLPVLNPEHESKRHGRKRMVFPVRELELNVEGNSPTLCPMRQDKWRGGETG
jgi:hypothetical protein